MKRVLLFVSLSFTTLSAINADVIISQYYEGASNNKWIEITNVGNSQASLDGLYFCLFSNDAADNPEGLTPNFNFPLSGTLAAGGTLLFRHTSAVLPSYASGTIASICNFNGDDLVIISTTNNNTAWVNRIDVVGNGNNWGADKSFYRNANVLEANTTFTLGEWTEVTIATVDNALVGTTERLGEHEFDAPLPINITSFTAKPMEANDIALHWTTASEENNDYFAIEHSLDGRGFYELNRVSGAGTTTEIRHYEFMHKGPERGTNYYRLKQVDFDGAFSFSEVEVVVLEDHSEINLQPTLAQENIEVRISENLANDGTIEVVNWIGQVIIMATFPDKSSTLTLNVSDLESGHYFVRIKSGNIISTSRFVKL